MFSEDLLLFMGKKKLIFVFCLQLLLFLQSITKSNHLDIQMASAKDLSKLLQCIQLLSDVSYNIEQICFWKIIFVFCTCQFFVLFLSTFSLFLVFTGQTFSHIIYILIFLKHCFKRKWLLDFGTTSFYTKTCDFLHICQFLLFFLFHC